MRARISAVTLLLSGLAVAFPKCGQDPNGHEYIAPGPNDSRSPCPGINALANHGYLPRDGKNIDLETMQQAAMDAYNCEKHFLDLPVAQALPLSTTGNASTFNLEDTKVHDAIEFDGSLSRNDFAVTGDALNFDPSVWHTTAERLGLADWRHQFLVDIETAAKARAARVEDAKSANKAFNASENQQTGTFGTSALYLTVLWDDKLGGAPKPWVKAFFEEDRIAYREGFKRPEAVRTGQDLFGKLTALQGVDTSSG